VHGVDPGEHVRLILLRVDRPGEQTRVAVLDDSSVVTGRECVRACTTREREQVRETKAAVAVNAGVRRLPSLVAADERIDDRAPECVTQVECDVRHAQPMAGRTRGQHGLRRAARALRVGPVRIEPEPKRDADSVRQ
jgi:hypothetical protein